MSLTQKTMTTRLLSTVIVYNTYHSSIPPISLQLALYPYLQDHNSEQFLGSHMFTCSK
jgi:hypothetical protein